MEEAVWHDDGHVMRLELDKDQVIISQTTCPQKGACSLDGASCIVEYFLDRYGLELNIGSCSITEDIRIAWTYLAEGRDIDAGQVWIIPTNDPVFAAWSTYLRE